MRLRGLSPSSLFITGVRVDGRLGGDLDGIDTADAAEQFLTAKLTG